MKLNKQNKILYFLISFTLFFFSFKSQAQIHNWTKTKKNFGFSYTPKKYINNEIFKVNIVSPKKIGEDSKEQYLMLIAKGFSNRLGKPVRAWKIYKNHDNEIYTKNFFNNTNSKVNIRVQTIETSVGVMMAVMLYSSEQTYMKVRPILGEIFEDAKTSILGNNIQSNVESETPTNLPIKRPRFESKNIQNLESVIAAFYTVDYNPITGMYGEPKEDLILEFTDGSVSKDFKTILQKGVLVSKQNKPKKWGFSRFRNNKYEVKWNKSKKFKTYESITKYVPISKDKRISGCWSTTHSYAQKTYTTGEHNTTLISYDYCFDKKGRFSLNKAAGTVNKQTSGSSGKEYSSWGASSNNKTGWYYIDGYTIQLIYDNGNKDMFFINLKNKKQNENYYLRLNNKMYFKKK